MFSIRNFVLLPIEILTFTPTPFYNFFDGIKQTLVQAKFYRIGVGIPLQSYAFPIPMIFLSYESNKPSNPVEFLQKRRNSIPIL